MNTQIADKRTRVVLSFSSAYVDLARRLAADLGAARIKVHYDQWEGGGGLPAAQSASDSIDEAQFVLPLLTPSDAAPTWIGDEWRRTVFEKARSRNIHVLPVRGELCKIPDFLSDRSFADLRNRDYALELQRLVQTIRALSGDAAIEVPVHKSPQDVTTAPRMSPKNPIVFEMGETVAALLNADGGVASFVSEMIPMMRDGLFYELGVQYPGIDLRTVTDITPFSVRILIYEVPETQLEVQPGAVMVNENADKMAQLGFAAKPAVNPASGVATAWIPTHEAQAAEKNGITVWDTRGLMILALSAVLRKKAATFIEIDKVRAMLKQLETVFPLLVAETVPKTVSLFILTDVLRRLVAEEISIRDLRCILMALADWGRVENDPLMLTEYVRAAMKRLITYKITRGSKTLPVFLLDPAIEDLILKAKRHTATGSYVDLEPGQLQDILNAIGKPLEALPDHVQAPTILTTIEVRSSVRRMVAPSLPLLYTVSYQELTPDVFVQPVGRITLEGFKWRDGITVNGIPIKG
jgi:type III secretion protein V